MSSRRSNEEWLNELRALNGVEQQALALQELRNYLYTVLYNYLVQRQDSVPRLQASGQHFLAELAQELVQDTLLKITKDDNALLDKFSGTGKFTSWAAITARNVCAERLRRRTFSEQPSDDLDAAGGIADGQPDSATQTIQKEIMDALDECFDRLPANRRKAFEECIYHNRRARDVAAELNRTDNAVNQLVLHAKRSLRACMEEKGFDADVIEFFE